MTLSVKSTPAEALAAIKSRLKNDSYWPSRLIAIESNIRSKKTVRIHVAIFVEPYLTFLLDGTKTVESRFSVNRCAPFQQAEEGDVILVKESGGGIVAICEIAAKWYYDLDQAAWAVIRQRFSAQLAIKDSRFWDTKKDACYASLFKVKNITSIDPLFFEKRDRRGWLILSYANQSQSLLL
jgi:hypothetical protein